MGVYCKCKAWNDNIPTIDSAITLMALRGSEFNIMAFAYCPYCGKKVIEKCRTRSELKG